MSPPTGMRKLGRASYASSLREIGWALKDSAPMQKHLAAALEMDPGDVSRFCRGQVPAYIERTHETIRKLVREARTDAGAFLAGFMLTAVEEASGLPVLEIVHRLASSIAQETLFEGSENVEEGRVLIALGRFTADEDPAEDDLSELRSALEAHDTASRQEMGRAVDCVIYNRALRVRCGWLRLS